MSRETKSAERAKYRYLLTRDLGSLLTPEAQRRVLFYMLNLSTATPETAHPTIRRVIRFGAREDATELTVVNLFAARATDPRKLPAFDDPVRPDNDAVIKAAARRRRPHHRSVGAYCPRTRRKDVPRRSSTRSAGTPMSTAWANPRAVGQPRHPLHLPANATRVLHLALCGVDSPRGIHRWLNRRGTSPHVLEDTSRAPVAPGGLRGRYATIRARSSRRVQVAPGTTGGAMWSARCLPKAPSSQHRGFR